jgi:hypothetical protein
MQDKQDKNDMAFFYLVCPKKLFCKRLIIKPGKIFARRAKNFRAMHAFAEANGCDLKQHEFLCGLCGLCAFALKSL